MLNQNEITMKTFNYLIIILAVLMLPVLAQGQDPHAELNTTPLEVHGDSVKFTATITVPKDKVFKHVGRYIVRPELGDKQFTPIEIPSSQLNDAARNGFTVQVSASALFDEDMIGNDLEIEHEYRYKDDRKEKEFDDMDDLAECCVTTGTLFSVNGQYELRKFEYTPASSAPLKVVAQINFPIDVATFPVNEYQDQVTVIGDYVKTHPDATVTIRGFASPEGPVERNKELAEERAQVAKDWLLTALNKKGYNINEQAINVETTTEDWKGFVQLVRDSDMPQEKQTEILNAVSTTESLQKLEDDLYQIVGNYDEVKEFMRPLRRTTIVASSDNAFREGYTFNQIDSINAKVNEGEVSASALKDIYTQEEYLQAYVRNDAETGKLTLLAAYAEEYPDDLRIYSDLGAMTAVDLSKIDIVGGDDALVGVGFDRDLVDIDSELDIDDDKFKFKYKAKEEDVNDPEKIKIKIKAEMEEAEGYLVKAYKAEPRDPVVLNNLGAFYLTTGRYDEAKRYLDQATTANSSEALNYNMGVYHARMGNLDKAVESFENAGNVRGIEYNRGLARVLTGNVEAGLADLQKFAEENPEHAITHYLVAVAAARANNERMVRDHLEEAFKRDDRLADVAEEDLEFRMYWDDEEFESLADDADDY